MRRAPLEASSHPSPAPHPRAPAGSSLVSAGAIAGTIALHQHSGIPKSCIVGSQVGLAAVATLAVHHIDLTSKPHAVCLAGSLVALGAGAAAASTHPRFREEAGKIPKECYIGTLGGLVLVVAGALLLSRK